MDGNNIHLDDIRAVILIGPLDFGRCRLASQLSPALWPMIEKPAINNIIDQLAGQGIKKITICSKVDDPELSKTSEIFNKLDIDVIVDELPAGTAGSLRDAHKLKTENTLLALPAGMAIVPDIKHLINKHRELGSDLTVMFHKPYSDDEKLSRSADIFICGSDILEYIPPAGYFDMKEHLIPKLVKDDKKIYPLQLEQHTGSFRNVPAYIAAMSKYLSSNLVKKQHSNLKTLKKYGDNVLFGEKCEIAESVDIRGPVVIFDNVEIEENVCISGPAVIGSQSWIGKNCLISDTFLWQGSGLWPGTEIKNSVISYDTEIKSGSTLNNRCVTPKKVVTKADKIPCQQLNSCLQNNFFKKISLGIAAFLVLFGALLISYFSTIKELASIWTISDEYSAGMLVPFLTGYVIWTRRNDLSNYSFKPSICGIIALLVAQFIRIAGLYLNMASLERFSLIMSIGAIVLLVMGWKLAIKLTPLVLFLLLSVPLPNQINQVFSLKLQEWATTSAVWTLEMLGYMVKRDGNIIHLGDTTVAVAEACNGLRMIMAFFVIAGWFALLANRKIWEKIIIFLSALPISILCNTIRLAVTAIAFTMIDAKDWAEIFHDYGGYAMMPIAIGLIIGELWILKNIFIVEDYKKANVKQAKKEVILRKNS